MSGDTGIVLTPTVARVLRRSLFWVAITGILTIVALIVGVVSVSTDPGVPMSATNPAPRGAKALAEVLRDNGVDVTVTDSLVDTVDAVTDREHTTLFYYDVDVTLSKQQESKLFGLAHTVVVLDPSPDFLEHMSPDIAPAGFVDGTLRAGCDDEAASAAGEITAFGSGYRVLNDSEKVTTCFSSGGVYSMVRVERDGTTYTALGAIEALSNGSIEEAGNAALGLHLLGTTEHLIWYVPGPADYEAETESLADLAPDWVPLVAPFAFVVAFAAMLWRGRRLGPVVIENLPVTVPASETMRGRARLYERSNARLHAADSLRIGAIARIAAACGLPVTATVDQVVLAAAAAGDTDQREVRALLVDEIPASDRALVHLSDRLVVLEQRITENLRPH